MHPAHRPQHLRFHCRMAWPSVAREQLVCNLLLRGTVLRTRLHPRKVLVIQRRAACRSPLRRRGILDAYCT